MLRKIAEFIVNRRVWILTAVLILTGVCAFLIPKVGINTDMTEYLADDSSMKIGMDIMKEEFPEAEADYTVRVMFRGLDAAQRTAMQQRLAGIANVTKVDYKPDDAAYNKDDYALFVLHTDYDYESAEEKAIEDTLASDFAENEMKFNNDSGDHPNIPTFVLVGVVVILTVILIIMCSSWLEPFLFLFTIGIAIVINLGTNIVMGSISETTFSVTAMLQMVLSMDYSIILANRYRQELEKTADRRDAMKAAVAGAFAAISSSSLTTVVGLLALVFMRFKIGLDLGVVLAKGVFISVVCVFLILPGLLLAFPGLLEKTRKPAPKIPTGGLAALCNRYRIAFAVLFVVLFAGAFYLKDRTTISYAMISNDAVAEVFPKDETVVIVYDNRDDAKMTEIASEMAQWTEVKSAVNFSNTLDKQHTAADMVKAIGELSESMGGDNGNITATEGMFRLLYHRYYGGEPGELTVSEFLRFLTEDVMTDPMFAPYMGDFDAAALAPVQQFTDVTVMRSPMPPEAMAAAFGMEPAWCAQLYAGYGMMHGGEPAETLTITEFVQFISDTVLADPAASGLNEAKAAQLTGLVRLISVIRTQQKLSAPEMAGLFSGMADGFRDDTVSLLYLYHDVYLPENDNRTMSVSQLMNYLNDTLIYDDVFKTLLDEAMVTDIRRSAAELNEGARQLRGPKYSRLILTVTIPAEGPETDAFYERINDRCSGNEGEYHVIGSSAMNYEMSRSFNKELLQITLLSAIAIFLVVLITFRSPLVPVVLVILVQCGVYITITVIGFQGYSINYLALLIVQCILMGSMIDYGILFSNYYRDARRTGDTAEALTKAYAGSIHTILTSGLIIVIVTAIFGQCFGEPTVEQICRTLSIGAASAILLILFVLPGVLACLDRFTAGRNSLKKTE